MHPNTVRAWSDAGRLRYYRINPRGDRRYRMGDLQRFLAAAEIGPIDLAAPLADPAAGRPSLRPGRGRLAAGGSPPSSRRRDRQATPRHCVGPDRYALDLLLIDQVRGWPARPRTSTRTSAARSR